jgi:hypothetical protein
MNTEINYLYRDASNYKFWGTFIVEGKIERSDLVPYLFDSEWFVPQQVGLEHLLNLPMNFDDHLLHELHEFVPTTAQANAGSAKDLIAKFRMAADKDWFHGINEYGRRRSGS